MNSKEQKIKEAYGEYWFEVRRFVNEHGWFDKNSLYNNWFTFKYSDFDVQMIHKEDFCIPKSILGIENNNGWISISEKGLPKDDSYYFVVIDGFISIKQFHIIQYKWWQEFVSHYQEIEKPKPPLY